MRDTSRLTQGFSIRCLRFTSDVAAAHARLASGWRAAPLPGRGSNPLDRFERFQVTSHSPFQDFSCRKGGLRQTALRRSRSVLAYLSRYTHRVAISNRRLLAFDETGVTFRYKDYRRDSADRQQVMTLDVDEFIRRFLLHVLPRGFHRIRHYGLLASLARKASLARARELLAVAPPPDDDVPDEPLDVRPPCPCCGGHMIIIETFERGVSPAHHRTALRQPRELRRDPARPHTVPTRSTPVAANARVRPSSSATPRSSLCQRFPTGNVIRSSDNLDRSRHVLRFPLSVVTSSRSAENRNTHRPSSPTTREFVPRGLWYAKRRPKLFTRAAAR